MKFKQHRLSGRTSSRTGETGVTLIEMMIGLVLGLLIMGASIQAFLANKQTYRFNAALSRMQEDGRYAIAAMARDIRMTGFAGCASRQQITVNTVADQNPPIIELDSSAIVGFDDSEGWWTQASPPQDHRGVDLTICDLAGGGGACPSGGRGLMKRRSK